MFHLHILLKSNIYFFACKKSNFFNNKICLHTISLNVFEQNKPRFKIISYIFMWGKKT